jgi:hypothetical protein
MSDKGLPLLLVMLISMILAPQMRGQETEDAPGFRRQYLEVETYRDQKILLRDWPALSQLVAWSAAVEESVAEEADTLSTEMFEEFRVRADSLATQPLPPFFTGEAADSVRATLEELVVILGEADSLMGEAPGTPERVAGEQLNTPTEERTLVTGNTAVRVPAGVAVGEADSLPRAELGPEELNFVDRLTLALTTIDRLVHLTRAAGGDQSGEVSREPTAEGSSSPTDRAAPPPEP